MKDKRIDRRSFVGGSLAASAALLGRSRVRGANDRIGIGMIGCGARAQEALLKEVLQFRDDANVEVVALCDTWRQMRDQTGEQVRAATGSKPRAYVRYQDLLADREVDAVVIATPEHQHCTQLVDALEAGKDAYVEKPLGMTMEEVNQAFDTVKKHRKIVQNGTQIRSLPQARAAKEFIESGGLGRLLKAEQSRNSTTPYWYGYADRPVAERDVDWDAFLMMREKRSFDPRIYAGWYGYREFCRGPHTTQGLHFVDTVHYVAGLGCPKSAIAHLSQVEWKDGFTVPDSVEMVFEYPEGMVVRYGQFFGNRGGRYLNVYGTRGTLDGSDWNWNGTWKLSGDDGVDAGKIPPGAKLPDAEGTPHMKNWLDCLRSRTEPVAPIEAGYAHAVAGIMADFASERGRKVVYDPAKRQILDYDSAA